MKVDFRLAKMVIVVRRDLRLSRGKELVQAAHAAVGATDRHAGIGLLYRVWTQECAQKKIVCRVDSEKELLRLAGLCKDADVGYYLVRDHGVTEVEPGTPTCLAIGPHFEHVLDPITSGLKLY